MTHLSSRLPMSNPNSDVLIFPGEKKRKTYRKYLMLSQHAVADSHPSIP